MAKQHVLRTSTKTGKAIRVERLKARSKPGHVPAQYWVVDEVLEDGTELGYWEKTSEK